MRRAPDLIPLSHQHHNGLALCVLTRRSLQEDSSPANVAALAKRAIDRYEIEFTNHFEIEEQILFPAIEASLGPQRLIPELIAQHREVEGLIASLRSAPAESTRKSSAICSRGTSAAKRTSCFNWRKRICPRMSCRNSARPSRPRSFASACESFYWDPSLIPSGMPRGSG